MNGEQVLKSKGIYLKNDLIGNVSSNIGYIKEFRWSWFATQMNTFIIIGQTTNAINRANIEAFSMNCYNYAIKHNKGWPRGLQAAVASIAILTGENIETPAIEFCEKLSKKHWAAFEIPVLYKGPGNKTYRFKTNPIWGTLYFPYFARLIDSITNTFETTA